MIGPDYPESSWPTGPQLWRHLRRVAVPVGVPVAIALLLVAAASLEVTRDRPGVERDLATARVAAARASDHLTGGDTGALDLDLDLLVRSAGRAQAGSDGLSWAVADRVELGGGPIRSTRRDAARIVQLADAAGPLRDSLAPLARSGTGPASIAGPDGLTALDDLARAVSRYATAAERGADPSAAAINRAAVTAGMLPALAGGDGPRVWTVCPQATGPCERIKVIAGRSGTPTPSPGLGTASPPGRRWAAGVDVLVIGVEPGALFPEPGRFDPAAVFQLLLQADRDAAITVRSGVGAEQQAIDQLARH